MTIADKSPRTSLLLQCFQAVVASRTRTDDGTICIAAACISAGEWAINTHSHRRQGHVYVIRMTRKVMKNPINTTTRLRTVIQVVPQLLERWSRSRTRSLDITSWLRSSFS